MLSPADLAIAGAAALILFGPDKLPGLARQIGKVTREIQSSGQSFIREIERAGDIHETFEQREARRIHEQGMQPMGVGSPPTMGVPPPPPPVPDYSATLASRPPRESEIEKSPDAWRPDSSPRTVAHDDDLRD